MSAVDDQNRVTDPLKIDDAPSATRRDSDAALQAVKEEIVDSKGDQVSATAVTIGRPAADLYAFWCDVTNFATFMHDIDRVDMVDDGRAHWVAKGPGRRTVEWQSRITEQQDNYLIAWTSEPGADVANSGKVEFQPAGDRGTVVTYTLTYDPPGGLIGKIIAKMFQHDPATQARRDLRRFKQLMETGEIATAAKTSAERAKEKE